MHRMTVRRALGLSVAITALTFGAASAIGFSTAGSAAPPDELRGQPTDVGPTSAPTPHGPAALPEQAADRASQAIAERGRDGHAQGPRDDVTTEAAPEDAGQGAGQVNNPGYGPGVHAGPNADFGPEVHPDADDHPDADNLPDTTNHPGGRPTDPPT